jgi:outer membrane protein assembly factor BamB
MQSDPAVLASTNGVTFLPARKLASKMIRALPERTLAAYRLRIGAPPVDLSGRSPPLLDLATLEASYRNGLPDAARVKTGLRLAGLYLDQERFTEARRLLQDLLDEVPTTDASRSDLLARLVVACARVGDTTQAQWAWAEIQKRGDTNRWASLGAEIRSATTPATPTSNAWPMAYGGPSRTGVATGTSPDLAADAGAALSWGLNMGAGMIGSGSPGVVVSGTYMGVLTRSYAVAQVTRKNRRPADAVIFAGNRAWVNGFGEFIVVDLATGRTIGRTPHVTDAIPRNTRFLSDGLVFGNRLNRAASLIGERVYCVEDNQRATLSREGIAVPAGPPAGNALAAYAADTGRLLWRLGRDVTPQVPQKGPLRWRATAICFAGAPVSCGGVLLAPIEDASGFGAVGLDAETGGPLWRTRLAVYPQVSRGRQVPVPLTVDGANAYVCSGHGSVSLLDGCDGSVRWTTLYETFADTDSTNRFGADGIPDMWEESVVLVAGEAAVVLPEDVPLIMAFDRRSGVRLWTRSKPAGVDYVVGQRGETLIVAGTRAVVGVELADGRERWRTPIAGSTGRGAICGTDVLIPNGGTLLRLNVEDGKPVGPVQAQTMDGLPLGNLYVNGDQLLVTGLERLYALEDSRPVLARVAQRLVGNPTAEAYAERGRFYADTERYTEAVPDLREAWQRQRGTTAEPAAHGVLLAALWRAAERDKGAAEKFYAEAQTIATSGVQRAEATWRWAQGRERTGNTNGALTLYVRLMTEPEAGIPPLLDDRNWEASAPRLAARRVRALLTDDEAKVRALLEEPASNALSLLGSHADAMALSDVATVFAGTSAARDAAFRAAQLAIGRGDMGIAEAILQRALALSAHSDREAVAAELVRLYERTKWPKGAATLCRQWRDGGKGPVPEFLERAARADVNAFPLPPWRLRWRKTLPANISIRLAPAGLCYSRLGPTTVLGCLNLTTGKSRWQKDVAGLVWMSSGVAGPRDDSSFVTIQGDSLACVDLWSGSVFPDVIRATFWEWSGYLVSRAGLATHVTKQKGGSADSADLLTGRGAWKRRECETLLPGMESIPRFAFVSAEGIWLLGSSSDGSSQVVILDPWTGTVVSSIPMAASSAQALFSRLPGRSGPWKVEGRMRGDYVVPKLDDQRLSGKDLRTGATVWTSPPDIAIEKQQSLPGGAILALTTNEEVVLLDGDTGAVLFRSKDIRFQFDLASAVDNAVVATYRQGTRKWVPSFLDGTNEVLVIDTAANAITFRGKLPSRSPRKMYPLRSLGAAMPDRLLVSVNQELSVKNETVNQSWIQVVNGQGEMVNEWRLPPSRELGTVNRRFEPVFAGELLLMVDTENGSVLAYEHDPGEGAKK